MISLKFVEKMAEARMAANNASTEEERDKALKLLEVLDFNFKNHEFAMNSTELVETLGCLGNSYKDLGEWEKALSYFDVLCNADARYCPNTTATARDFYDYSEICINMALNATVISHQIMTTTLEYPEFTKRLERQIECLKEFITQKRTPQEK